MPPDAEKTKGRIPAGGTREELMDFRKNSVRKRLHSLQSSGERMRNKTVTASLRVIFFALVLAIITACAVFYGAVQGVIAGAPDVNTIDVSPQGIRTQIYDSGGNIIQTLVKSGSNRDPVTYDRIPDNLKDAFVAIEDSRFWDHEGVDIRGIFRATLIGIGSGFRSTQGASTITQQLIKNNVLGGGQESTLGAMIVRKIEEQYLAIELEKKMSKEEILTDYLNTINLGSNCLGVQTAAKRYFNKDVSELTLSECAVIAGITQNPAGYNPITHPEDNAKRRATILEYMLEQGYITSDEYSEAIADSGDVYERIKKVNQEYQDQDDSPYSYFVDRLITEVERDLVSKCGYTEDEAFDLIYSGGLKIYTTQDSSLQKIVDKEVSDPSNYESIENKYSFTYSLAVNHGGKAVYYNESDVRKTLGLASLDFSSEKKAKNAVKKFKNKILQDGDSIIQESYNTVMQPQASVVLMDQATGEVKAITGGRGTKYTSLSLNRATSTRRSPGSTFKVLTSFAPAIDACGQTLASVYYDEPYTEPTTGKQFRNWWGSDMYIGYANIRDGIEYSMNILAVKTLMDTVTPKLGFEYAENFGINTLYAKKEVNGQVFSDISPSLALGGLTDGVTNLQMTAAYAAIANKGTYTQPILYTKILNNKGEVLIDNTPETHQVLKESSAFLLTDAMRGSLQEGTLFDTVKTTSTAAALDNGMPAAGKSGTSTGRTDLWFVGYTPYYTMGIWSGYDDMSKMEANESSSYHKIIWKHIMDRVDAEQGLRPKEFKVPSDIVQCEICAKSGKLVNEAGVLHRRTAEGMVYTEYFKRGTEPHGMRCALLLCRCQRIRDGAGALLPFGLQ